MADINVPGPVHFSENGMEGTFSWSASFSARIGSNFSQAQKYVDSEVLRYSDPMTPKKTDSYSTPRSMQGGSTTAHRRHVHMMRTGAGSGSRG